MNWTSLTAAKGVSGSIANWVAYTKIDTNPVVDEAQALIFETLRVREMMTQYVFRLATGGSEIALPAYFLDPIGRIFSPTLNMSIPHKDQSEVTRDRTYTTTNGNLGASPFTTTSGSTKVSVALTGHNFNQGSIFTIAAATAVNGITPNGTFPVVTITDANNFVVETSVLGQTASGSGSGGGSVATYVCDNLIAIPVQNWAIWDKSIKFDGATNADMTGVLNFYKSFPLLSSTNQTNFLTNRYPNLMRKACVTAAADFMDDTEAKQGHMTELVALIQRINVENEGYLRGAEIDALTP